MIYTGGNLLNSLFISVVVTSATASAIASGGSGARILYAMGRDRVLPKRIFGYVSPKFQTPIFNILMIACVAMSAVFWILKQPLLSLTLEPCLLLHSLIFLCSSIIL